MSEWVTICTEEGQAGIEVETEADGVLLLESVTAHYPGTTTLKYWNNDRTAYRGVKCVEGKMAPPTGGWDQASLYICVNPNKVEPTVKRKAASEERDYAKSARHHGDDGDDYEFDPEATIDLILLGLNPQTTEQAIREVFEERGKVRMVQLKKSKDNNVGYAFIRFDDKEVERALLREKFMIEGKQAYLKIPNSQQGERSERKVYVSYHNQEITVEDLRIHFEKYGDVEDVFIPTPWKHFCFVTFCEKRVANALIGKEHTLKGVSLLIKSLTQNKEKEKMGNNSSMGMMGYGMGMGGMGMGMGMGNMGGGMGMGNMGNMGNMGMMPPGMGGGMGMFGNGDRQSGPSGNRGRGNSEMGKRDGGRDEQGQPDGVWPGRERYGYGQMFGEQSYGNRGKYLVGEGWGGGY